MSKDAWLNWPIIGWQKLNDTCTQCGRSHADIRFDFKVDTGTVARSWHWTCLPHELRIYQSADESAMIQEAQTPPESLL